MALSDMTSNELSRGDGDGSGTDAEIEELRRPLVTERQRGQGDDVLDSKNGSSGPYRRDLHVLSFSFLFLFLAYSATQNLESSINTDGGLGSAALGVLYLSFTISSLGANFVVLSIGSKRALLLGLSGYLAFIAANLYPSWYTLIPAAVYLGFTASVLWVAQGTYLTFIAKKHAIACKVSEASTLGEFNGEFFSVFQLNQVVGNLLTLVLLQSGQEEDSSGQSSLGTAKIFVTFLGSITIAASLLCLLRPHSIRETLPSIGDGALVPVGNSKASTSFMPLFDKKMLLFTCLLFYSGMQQAFIWGDFTRDVITSTIGLSWVGGVMAAFGVSCTVASYVTGRISSGLVSITVIILGGAFCQILVLAGLYLRALYGTGDGLDFAISFGAVIVWALGDSSFNPLISSFLSILYPDNVEAAFAQWKLWQSAGTSAVFFASPYLSFTTKLLVLFSSLLLSMGLFFKAMVLSIRGQ